MPVDRPWVCLLFVLPPWVDAVLMPRHGRRAPPCLGSGVGRFRVARNPCDDKHMHAAKESLPASTQHIISHPSGVFKLNSIPSSQKESSSKACDDSRRTTDALVPRLIAVALSG
jgi:hypothetical protein